MSLNQVRNLAKSKLEKISNNNNDVVELSLQELSVITGGVRGCTAVCSGWCGGTGCSSNKIAIKNTFKAQ